ncbi:MAG TPA: MarR family transcriptional regulator [Acetobacterium sp.]
MKKDKKNKKSELKEVKDSKKEIKKKSAPDEKKIEVVHKKTKPTSTSDIPAFTDADIASLKKEMMVCANLYQNILILPRTFIVSDGEHSLFPSELKALDMIGGFSPINLTQLANKLGISKSAVSKCSGKLLEKGLITKEKSLTNIREVVFMLSETGQSIYYQLENKHSDLFKPITAAIDGFSNQEISELQQLFSNLKASLNEINEDLQK